MVRKTDDENQSTEKGAENANLFNEDQLRGLASIEDVFANVSEPVTEIGEVLGDGFSVLENKSDLVGVRFVVVTYETHTSEINGGQFSSMRVITEKNDKYIVNDGSTGIHAQCAALLEKTGKVAPLLVPGGLRMSEYDYDDNGQKKRARTYYLATSK